MAANQQDKQETEHLYEELYERYGKPLENKNKGKYLAVSKEGKTILGSTLREVARKATEIFGRENFIYKVGDKAVGTWR